MKAFASLILMISLLAGVYVATTTTGCGARAQVAGDKVMDKIDKWLGELDVKRKEIANSIDELENAVDRTHKAKVSAEVRLEEIDKKAKPIQKRIDGIKVYLAEINIIEDAGGNRPNDAKYINHQSRINRHVDFRHTFQVDVRICVHGFCANHSQINNPQNSQNQDDYNRCMGNSLNHWISRELDHGESN